MKKLIIFIGLIFSSVVFTANAKTTSLSCPGLDKRAQDLEVVLDAGNGTASLQSPSSGSGLNFTEKASFGSELVTWSKKSSSFKQTFSVNRETLELQRKTYSNATGETYLEKTTCSLKRASKSAKF
ncbi:hypothetical protein CCR28_24425 [Salmonella enterica]|nr:hypothetical protein [Salmonella enterica]ECD4441847.1 hypothetical protein [Salmonella enterica subsp. enterica serovar Florida]EEG1560827.1 hypothetical protein [Salmonella enterica subsp. enterica serovar Midway]EAX7378477.1 hypothetical protein [Salmonella enterica]EAZ0768557.1 hypothetical protein [Salmonella enterica]